MIEEHLNLVCDLNWDNLYYWLNASGKYDIQLIYIYKHCGIYMQAAD